MLNKNHFEKEIKRFIKKKKIGYSFALLISFLITGELTLSEDTPQEYTEILKKIEQNKKRIKEIELENILLIKEGDYYAKTLENNKQFFFPLTWEHRHATKGEGDGSFESLEKPDKPTEPNKPIEPDKPINPDKPIDPEPEPEKPTEPIIPTEPDLDIPEIVVITPPIIPENPVLPTFEITTPEFKISEISQPEVPTVFEDISIEIETPELTAENIKDVIVDVGEVTITDIDPKTVPPEVKLTGVTEVNTDIKKREINNNYDPRFIPEPKTINISPISVDIEIPSAELKVAGESFSQGAGGIQAMGTTIAENFDSYTGDNFSVNFKEDGNIGTITGNLKLGVLDNKDTKNLPNNVNFYGELGKMKAFISDTTRLDTKVEGNFSFKNISDTARIAISLNPSGLFSPDRKGYDISGNIINQNGQNSIKGPEINDKNRTKKVMTITENTNLNLSNTSESDSAVLIGIDHQTWDRHNGGGVSDTSNAYSTLLNNGTINLKKDENSEINKNMLGIMITVEQSLKDSGNNSNPASNKNKNYNNETINNGTINIEDGVTQSVGISFEEGHEKESRYQHLRDDLYAGTIDINGSSNYGLRMKNIMSGAVIDGKTFHKDDYFDDTRIYGSLTQTKAEELGIKELKDRIITVGGNNNTGVVIGKSLSHSAVGYIGDGKYVNDIANSVKYTGGTKGNSGTKFEEETATTYYQTEGTVNPIANIHGLNITVNGTGNIGFLRDRDYSNNNKNDMVIQKNDSGKEAITEIKFGENATNSVLIRSDKYGITVEKDIDITPEIQTTSDETVKDKNVVLQATASTWSDGTEDRNSVGYITNKANISGTKNNIVGMVASGSLDAGQEDSDITQEGRSKTQSEIINSGNINLTGTSNIGMAVFEKNIGTLNGGEISVKGEIPSADEKDYNLGIYNEGTFNITNGTISTDGKNSIGIYNIGKTDDEKTGKITIDGATINADNGAVGIYSVGGEINSSNGKLVINSNEDGMGIYAKDGAKINITSNEKDKTEKNKITVTNGTVGIASVGSGSDIKLENTDLYYSGDGYALYTDDSSDTNGSTISSLKGTTLTLGGKSFGLKLDITKNSDGTYKEQPINLEGLNIVVDSNNATVFNLVNKTGGDYNIQGLLTNINDEIKAATGGEEKGFDIANDIKAGENIKDKLYKIAIVDGGTLTVNENISQATPEFKEGEEEGLLKTTPDYFYFKRFLGQRLKIDVNENITIDGTMSGEHADKYFQGQMVGMEINSSSFANSNTDTSITLNNGSKIIANRLTDSKTEGVENKGAIGIYSNFGTVTLNEGSSVEVEKQNNNVIENWNNINKKENEEIASEIKEDKIYDEGIGVFAVNGSKVDTKSGSKIDVYGDKGIGIFSLAYREENNDALKDEFGLKEDGTNKDQGKVSIINGGEITLLGQGTVGIYAENNNIRNAGSVDKDNVKVTNTGTITVGDIFIPKDNQGNIIGDETDYISSIGIYGIGATIENTGIITAGTNSVQKEQGRLGSVGIYADNSNIVGSDLGEITLGTYGTGIYLTNGSDITATGDLKITADDKSETEKMGVFYDGTVENAVGNYNIDMSSVVGGKALLVKNGELNFNGEISVNEKKSRGIRVLENGIINVEESSKISVGEEGNSNKIENEKSSIGILAKDSGATINNKGTIDVNSNYGIGIYVTNESVKEGEKENTLSEFGTINLNNDNTTALFLENYNDSKFAEAAGSIIFDTKYKNQIGIYSNKSNLNFTEDTEIKIVGNGNTFIYGNDTILTNNGTVIASGDSEAGRNVAINLTGESTYIGEGSIKSEAGAIGIYADGKTKVDNIKTLTVDSQGKNTIGAVLKNKEGSSNLTITEINLINTGEVADDGNKSIGVYSEGVNLNIDKNKNALVNIKHDGSNGIGFYFADGGKALGAGKVIISGKGKPLNGKTPISSGLYYSETAGNENNVNLEITKDNAIGLFAKKTLINNGDININVTGEGQNVGIYTVGNEIIQNGDITLTEKSKNSIGIYALDKEDKKGNITFSSGTINVETDGIIENKSVKNGAFGLHNETGIISTKEDTNINVIGDYGVGIYSKGEVNNNGTISLTGLSSTGIFITGENGIFNGDGGTINVATPIKDNTVGIGIYLKDGAKLGNGVGSLTLGENDTGIYIDNSSIDGSNFTNSENGRGKIDFSSSAKKSVAVSASAGRDKDLTIKNLDINLGKEMIGIYAVDQGVHVDNIKITGTSDGKEDGYSSGIYLDDCDESDEHEIKAYEIKNSEINIKKGFGIFAESNITTSGEKLNHNTELNISDTTINVDSYIGEETKDHKDNESGFGIYLQNGGRLTSSTGNTYTVKEGIGVYGEEDSVIALGGTYKEINSQPNFTASADTDTINHYGYSVGAFTKEGKIYIGNIDATFAVKEEGTERHDKVAGALAYAQEGDIYNEADIKVEEKDGKVENFVVLMEVSENEDHEHTIENKGDISVKGDSSIGIASIGKGIGNIKNSGDIYISRTTEEAGKMSAGIYSEGANIENAGKVTVGDRSTGILYKDHEETVYQDGITIDSTGEIEITGKYSIGASLEGKLAGAEFSNITLKENISDALGIYLNNVKKSESETAEIKFDNITLKDNSIGLVVSGDSDVKITGEKIALGESVSSTDRKGNVLGVVVENGAKADLGNTKISVGKDGTALYVNNGTTTIDSLGNLSAGAGKGAFVYAKGGTIKIENPFDDIVVNGNFGLVAENGGIITRGDSSSKLSGKMTVKNGGTGLAIIGTGNNLRPRFEKIEIRGNDDINSTTKSAGVYYKDALNTFYGDFSRYDIVQNGSHTVGIVLDNTYSEGNIVGGLNGKITVVEDGITVGVKDIEQNTTESIGMLIKNNGTNNTVISVKSSDSNLAEKQLVEVKGAKNIGIATVDSNIETVGKIKTNEGKEKSFYPIGVYLSSENETYSYKGNGDIQVGRYSTGVYGKNYNIDYTGNIDAFGEAIGIYGEGNKNSNVNIKFKGDILASTRVGATENIQQAIGIYGKNANIDATGNIKTGTETESKLGDIGIASVGNGDINYSGDVEVGKNSIGIYKQNGSGTITTEEGKNFAIGESGIGIAGRNPYSVDETENPYKNEKISITNNSDMTLGTNAIGIYSYGINNAINNGNITVGTSSDNKNSIGIYMINDRVEDGKDSVEGRSKGENYGNISVEKEHSIGVQLVGYVDFSNYGKIKVDNGATGIYVTNGARFYNEKSGEIILGDGHGKDVINVGIRATGESSSKKPSRIFNAGKITVNEGIGIYVEDGAKFTNTGTLSIKNGYGIGGSGDFTNIGGTVELIKGGTGEVVRPDGSGEGENTLPEIGNEDMIIKISDNIANVSNRYSNFNGILKSDYDLNLENPIVDITLGNGLGFEADKIKGSVRISPNFALTGNGYSYEVKDFFAEGTDVKVNSPYLFKSEIKENDLILNKIAYKDIVKDSQYNNMYDGLDELLVNDVDSDIIKNINNYLGSFENKEEFQKEYKNIMNDIKGNIYSNVQSRMQDLNRAFDNSFDEMESSYNLSKDTDKFSLIYTNGDYRNSKSGIAEYDYDITGLLYMKEFDGMEFGNKYGYTFGFAGSRFKFEDNENSEEKVYSLRAGAHNVKNLGKGLELLTKGEAGFNYHETERKFLKGLKNDADFTSYHFGIENIFRKNLYKNYENEFGMYLGLDLEYGRFSDIKEDGDLRLKVKGNDYFSSKASIGFNGTGRKYLGNDWTMKATGDIGYSYDFGKNYEENEAKLRDSSKGYYSLMNELETKGKVAGKIGVGFERLNYLGVTLEGQVSKDFKRDEDFWSVGVRFNYKFNN